MITISGKIFPEIFPEAPPKKYKPQKPIEKNYRTASSGHRSVIFFNRFLGLVFFLGELPEKFP
jgi:hypothetical protein